MQRGVGVGRVEEAVFLESVEPKHVEAHPDHNIKFLPVFGFQLFHHVRAMPFNWLSTR